MIKAAKLLDLQIAGVDYIYDEKSDRYYILEVNSSPGFTLESSSISEFPKFVNYLETIINE